MTLLTYIRTQHDDLFFIWLGKWIGGFISRQDNYGTMNTGSCPIAVCMPPESSFLGGKYDLVREVWSRFNGTLCDVRWTIWPWISWLFYPMPVTIVVYVKYISERWSSIHLLIERRIDFYSIIFLNLKLEEVLFKTICDCVYIFVRVLWMCILRVRLRHVQRQKWVNIPVNSHSIVSFVVNIDIRCVPFVNLYNRPRKTAIYD